MAVARATRSVLLLLFACLMTFSATPSLRAADATGMLAMLQPATDDAAGILKLYSLDATLVHEMPLPADTAISAASLSPDGQHWVILSGDVSGPEVAQTGEPLQADLTLHILRTLDGTETIAIPLLPPNFPENIAINAAQLRARDHEAMSDAELEESTWQAFRFSLGIFAWSPDGTQLAFSGALDGPSSDLYLYDLTTNRLTRLTDGIEQIEGIRWSPDGQWIWHSTISYAYCQTCGGHHYAAAADSSRMVNLPGDDIYHFLNWVDGDTYLVTDQANGPGAFALQLVDVPTGKSTMLWAGAHQGHIYDPAMQRLGIIGTRSKSYDPNEQVFVLDLATGAETEYDDLARALVEEPWLTPLDQFPIHYPCARPGPLVYPCIDTPFDALSPDGAVQVTEDFAVGELNSGDERLPSLPDLAAGRILWRPDGAGYFITQPARVGYRDLTTGDLTWIEATNVLGWLPLATPADFVATATPPATIPSPRNPPSTPRQQATPTAEAPTITLPFRRSTLDGSPVEVACELRAAHAAELTALTHDLLAEDTSAAVAARASGLPLLLAREAYATTTCPYLDLPPSDEAIASATQTLNDALAASPPAVASYPPSGALPTLNTLALSPDGKVIATGHSDGTIRLWDYEIGTLTRVLSGALTSIRQLTFSSDSTMLAATDQVGNVPMWNINDGVQSSVHVGRYLNTLATVWRPDTYDLAVANGSDPVLIHPRDKAAHELLPEAAEALAYSPDGTQLAVALQPRYPQPSALPIRQPIHTEERPIWIVDADTGETLMELEDAGSTYFMSYTPDGNTLLVAGNNQLRAWDLATATLHFTTALPDFPNGWAITPEGDEIALLTRRGGIAFYDLTSGDNVRNLPVDASVLTSLAIHPVEGDLISGEINGRPLLFNVFNGTPSFRFDPPRARLATTSPTDPLLATADIRTITLYALDTQSVIRELTGAENLISDIAFSSDGNWLAAREETGHLLLWEVHRGTLLWRVQISNEWLGRVAFAPDGRIVITGSDGVLRVIDPTDGALLEQRAFGYQIIALAVSAANEATVLIGAPNGLAMRVNLKNLSDENAAQIVEGERAVRGQLAYNADGSMLALIRGSADSIESAVELWDTASNRLRQSIPLGEIYILNALAFTPDGQHLATGAHRNRPLTLWNLDGTAQQTFGSTGYTYASTRLAFTSDGTQLFSTDELAVTTQYSLIPSHTLRTMRGHGDGLWDVDVSPFGQWAVTASDDHTVRVWDWQTGAQLYQLAEEPDRVLTVSYSPDGYTILVGSDDGVARLYDTDGALRQTFEGHTEPIINAIFRPDGLMVATSSTDGSVRAWNAVNGEREWSITGLSLGLGALAYSPDSSLLAGGAWSGPETTVYLWDAATGKERNALRGHSNPVIELAFSPDGTLLASASFDRTIKLWDVATGEEIATLAGHSDILTGIAFSPDGTRLASVAEDYTLRLWDVASATALTTIDLPKTMPYAVTFGPTRHALLTTHADGTLRTWLTDPTDSSIENKLLIAAARVGRATAQFSQQERVRYAIDTYIGAYALSASANINLRAEPVIKSLVVQPRASDDDPETLIALTNENFLLTSTNQGESWRIVTRLPITLTTYSLSLPARPDDPLLLTSAQGLYGVGDDGALTLIHGDAFTAISYSPTNANELWAIRGNEIVKSEDGGATWGAASANLGANKIYAPLLLTSPNNNPQLVTAQPQDVPVRTVWRGAGNGFWERLVALPILPNGMRDEQGMAWDAGNRTLYLGGATGELFASTAVDAPDPTAVTATIIEQFGLDTRVIPLAVGQGPSLYLNLLTTYGPRLLRGTWDGTSWQWFELRLPLVAAG